MKNTLTTTALSLVAASLMLGTTVAQQASAPKPKTASPSTTAKTPAHKGTPAAKPKAATATTGAPSTQKEKISYAIGMSMGKSLQRQSVDVDSAFVLRGLKDTLSGGKVALTDEEAQNLLTQLQSQMRKDQEAKMKQLEDTNKKEGEAFLAKNKSAQGVVTLPSGLQYKILTEGNGPKPTASDTVVCNYKGTLLNGKEFDSSYKRGQPATFPVSGVIKGWTEALQLMPVGSKWQLFIPSDLAYGDRGAGADIQPGSTLIFEVELMSIKAKEESKK
jgi:FKBP-type peptidyl-prolyl cis-trans isomerase